ncbi:MAG: TIGR01777 family protein [Legionellales bacterium]|nr:TIGR01777 family protein [Legionellales bacterium]
MLQHYIIAGGTGFIGQQLVQHWLEQGIRVTVVSRTLKTVQNIFGDSVKGLTWVDLEQHSSAQLHPVSLIVNLCGASVGEKRWTENRKTELIRSRMQSTTILSQLCAALADKAPILFNASAASFYGYSESPSPVFDEDSPINLNQTHHFLSDLAHAWEESTEIAKAHGVHVINLRFGVVLGKGGGILKKMTLPFKLGLGGKLGDGTQPMSWIHIRDVVNIIDFLREHPELHGGINLTAPEVVTQLKFAQTLAHTLKRPSCFSTSAKFLKYVYGEMADELLLSGQAVYPKRLLEAGYQFQFPSLEMALQDIVAVA